MSENDYAEDVRLRNRKLLSAKEIKMTPESFLEQLRLAFRAGQEAGEEEKSLFERIFG